MVDAQHLFFAPEGAYSFDGLLKVLSGSQKKATMDLCYLVVVFVNGVVGVGFLKRPQNNILFEGAQASGTERIFVVPKRMKLTSAADGSQPAVKKTPPQRGTTGGWETCFLLPNPGYFRYPVFLIHSHFLHFWL